MKSVIKQLTADLISVEMLMYMLFGSGTAFIDFFTAKFLYSALDGVLPLSSSADVVVANTISFILSVTFAYFTNKYFVFKATHHSGGSMKREACRFFLTRFSTFLLSLAGMVLLVDKLNFKHDTSKLGVTVLVVVLNYVFSKLIIFKKCEAVSDGNNA